MKKFIFMMAALFVMGTATTFAQDKTDKNAAKAAKKNEKAAKKADKNAQDIIKFEEFLSTYKPIEANTTDPNCNSLITSVNTLFVTLNSIYDNCGYIEIETEEKVDDVTGETVKAIKRVYDKRTNEDIDVETAKGKYNASTKEVLGLVASAATLSSSIQGFVSNPTSLISLGPSAITLGKHWKWIAKLILPPNNSLISNKIKNNKEILDTYKNN